MASPEILCSLSLVVDAIALSKRAYNLDSPQILIYGDVGGVNPIIERTLRILLSKDDHMDILKAPATV